MFSGALQAAACQKACATNGHMDPQLVLVSVGSWPYSGHLLTKVQWPSMAVLGHLPVQAAHSSMCMEGPAAIGQFPPLIHGRRASAVQASTDAGSG